MLGAQPGTTLRAVLELTPACAINHALQICQNLRNHLQHPNEFIRGVTLRFLCRIREEEILEPLIPSILGNLEHRHSYVRRNAVLAVNAIYKLPKGELMLQVMTNYPSKNSAVGKATALLGAVPGSLDRSWEYLVSLWSNTASHLRPAAVALCFPTIKLSMAVPMAPPTGCT